VTTQPLRVCIDVSAAVHQRAGLGRYAQELVKGWSISSLVRAATAPQGLSDLALNHRVLSSTAARRISIALNRHRAYHAPAVRPWR
jgi:hypothetical protein